MNKTKIELNLMDFPEKLRPYMEGAMVYDSSCSDHAKVYYSDLGYYIKVEEKGKLEVEARAVSLFAERNLGPEMVLYVSTDKDFMVTKEAVGEDCLLEHYLNEPERLCRVLADAMKFLHGLPADVPVSPCMQLYQEQGYGPKMKCDTFIHGDFCLPNLMLDDWKLSGFIDVGLSGRGDKHIDIYWALWSLNYNLKTDKYTDLFLDLYGRENIDMDILRIVAAVEKM
ncbi:MAG: phosphotransferase [Lachnospiraceae bacterium]|nr:phosphotransferase [Lachnospiraceae bacterium]